jgi:hypothetical protein
MKDSLKIFFVIMIVLFASCESAATEEKVENSNAFQENVRTDLLYAETYNNLLTITDEMNLKVGEILLLQGKEEAYAKRVVEINQKQAILEDADLENVFNDVEISNTVKLQDAKKSLKKIQLATKVNKDVFFGKPPRVSQKIEDDGIRFYIKDYIIYNKKKVLDVRVENAGIFLKCPEVDYKFNFRKRKAELSVKFGESINLEFSATAKQHFFIDKSIVLGTYTIPINIAGITVANANFVLILNMGVDGKANLVIEAKQEQSVLLGGKVSLSKKKVEYDFYREFEKPKDETYSMKIKGKSEANAWTRVLPSATFSVLGRNLMEVNGDFGINAKVVHQHYNGVESLKGQASIYANTIMSYHPICGKVQKKPVLDWKRTFTVGVVLD